MYKGGMADLINIKDNNVFFFYLADKVWYTEVLDLFFRKGSQGCFLYFVFCFFPIHFEVLKIPQKKGARERIIAQNFQQVELKYIE